MSDRKNSLCERQKAWHGDFVLRGRIEALRNHLRRRRKAWHVDYVPRGRIGGEGNRLGKWKKDLREILLTRCEVDQSGCVLVAHVLDG